MPREASLGARRAALTDSASRTLALRSPLITRFFVMIFERTLRSHFHAIRLSLATAPPAVDTPRLVLYTNHPSWWDACIYVAVCARIFPGRIMRAPIDAAMVAKYPFMPRIGIFGVEQRSAKGSAAFLSICRQIFATRTDLLIIAAQGRFADPRERPIVLQPGIAHLNTLADDVTFVPLAIDYCFWTERGGEVLLRFGKPIRSELHGLGTTRRLERLETELAVTMDALAVEAIARDPGAFRTILSGRRGANPIFDAWRRFRAALAGRRYDVGHESPK